MNQEFQSYVDELPILFEELIKKPLLAIKDHKDVPKMGIYVFYENGEPLYVGRTNRMKTRIQEHARPSSPYNSASFAFLIAKKEAANKGINIKRPSKDLVNNSEFDKIHKETKGRVSNMLVRFIEIKDQVSQTLFEVYASIELKTVHKFNKFDNH